MLRYWYALIQGRFKLWQLLLLGALWVAGGVVFQVMLGGGEAIPFAALLVFSGVAHWVIAARAMRFQQDTEARLDQLASRNAALDEDRGAGAAPSPEPRRPEPVRPAAPRIGDDPFRDPPAPAPIVVVNTAAPPPAAPIAAGNPDDKPKILR